MILGLDISTSVTGVAIVDSENKIVYKTYWDLKKHKDFFDKALFVKDKIYDLRHKFGNSIKQIYIEQSLQSFRSGFSSAKTLSTLARFNGTVSWICYQHFRVKPDYVAATSARKLNGITVPKGKKAKEVVMQFLLDNEPDFSVDYTKNGNIKTQFYDVSDAIVIARAGFVLENDKKEDKDTL